MTWIIEKRADGWYAKSSHGQYRIELGPCETYEQALAEAVQTVTPPGVE